MNLQKKAIQKMWKTNQKENIIIIMNIYDSEKKKTHEKAWDIHNKLKKNT